jgi:NAD(P)-dependent dehydrogenase (short-subunit alcohol dehydrogenase family)
VSDLSFSGRTAVVTGAGTGLGRRCALLLAQRGASVVVHDTDGGEASRVAGEIDATGGTAIPVSVALDTPEGGQAVVAAGVDRFGGVDVVVAQQTSAATSAILDMGTDAAGVLGAYYEGLWLVQAAWAHLRERGYGRIVLTCPVDGSLDGTTAGGDAITSLGLMGLMNVLKLEGPDRGVKVNMVAPTGAGDPDAALHLATYLAHESCVATGEIFTAGADGMARMFMGVNQGYFGGDLSNDAVRDHLNEILSPEGFIVPDEAGQEIATVLLPLLR